jgi:hypothetical protein
LDPANAWTLTLVVETPRGEVLRFPSYGDSRRERAIAMQAAADTSQHCPAASVWRAGELVARFEAGRLVDGDQDAWDEHFGIRRRDGGEDWWDGQ